MKKSFIGPGLGKSSGQNVEQSIISMHMDSAPDKKG